MYRPVTLFIGLRYMRGGATDRFGRFIGWLSTLGIMLGVMALVIVLSVMNGFEHELQQNTLGLMPQAIVTTAQGNLNPQQYPAQNLVLSGIDDIIPLTTADIVLQSAKSITVGVLLGVNADDQEPLFRYLENVNASVLQPGSYQIILGKQLARKLSVKINDRVRLMVPSISRLTPMGNLPAERLFTVAGYFSANSDVDDYQVLVNQQDASRLMYYPLGNITGWRLWLKNPLKIDNLMQKSLPKPLIIKDWREKKGDLFQAVRMEKTMMGLLLGLIIAVAAFNILASLGLQVMDKKGEVAIFLTQGLTRRQIISIFVVQGAAAGTIGALSGALLGILVATQLNYLMPLLGVFLEDALLPVMINYWQVATVIIMAFAITLLATFYPSWRAAAIQPAEALRYE